MSEELDKKAITDAKRFLAKIHHPDKDGGDVEAMKAVNLLADAAEFNWDDVNPEEFDPQADVQVDARPAEPKGSDEERIANARAISIQRDLAHNSDITFGGQHSPRFFINTRGFGSGWLARHIMFLAQLINTPASLIDGKYLRDSNLFDPTTGIFESDSQPLSLVDLTVAYKLQIKELGLSEPSLEEFLARADYDNMQAFYALDFDSRMEKFR